MAIETYRERTLLIIDAVFQQLLAVFVLLIIWEVFKNYTFNNAHAWHVVLSTIGVGLCMAEGLLLFNRENSFLKEMDRVTRGTVHGVVMFIACVSLTVGISLKINQKNQGTSQHFATTHSIFGVIAWMLTFIAVIGGALAASVKRFPSLGKPSLFRIIHLLFGLSAYVFGVIALGFGIEHLETYTFVRGRNVLVAFLALYVAYSLIGPIKSCYNHFFR